jgi:hypothetical protein
LQDWSETATLEVGIGTARSESQFFGLAYKTATYHFTSPSPIPKSVNPGRLKESFAASERNLDPAAMAALVTLDCRYRYVDGTFWNAPEAGYTVADLWDEQ